MIHHGLRYDNQENWQPICGYGQSPIHIKSTDALIMEDEGSIDHYNTVECSHIILEQTTILINAKAPVSINGRRFHLIQFHFHSPAEHIIDDESYPMELHFVHRSQSGRLAVFAIMIRLGKENDTFSYIMEQSTHENSLQTLTIRSLFPEQMHYYHYLGSLTTPPLTENVEWYVFSDPIEISQTQLMQFRALYHHTARKIQPTNNRAVLYHKASD